MVSSLECKRGRSGMSKPRGDEVDKCISDLALRELRDLPIGSSVKVSEGIGYKKMPHWWVFRVFGLKAAIKSVYEEIIRRRRSWRKHAD